MTRSVNIEHERNQGAFEFRARAFQNLKARAADFHASLDVENAQFFADFPVRFRLEIELFWLAEFADFDIFRFACAVGSTRMWRVR